jgi:hypothetical protein
MFSQLQQRQCIAAALAVKRTSVRSMRSRMGECLNPGKEFLLNQGLFFAENDIFADGTQVIGRDSPGIHPMMSGLFMFSELQVGTMFRPLMLSQAIGFNLIIIDDFYNRFFSALPAPVPLYFDGVTLKR